MTEEASTQTKNAQRQRPRANKGRLKKEKVRGRNESSCRSDPHTSKRMPQEKKRKRGRRERQSLVKFKGQETYNGEDSIDGGEHPTRNSKTDASD